MSQQINHAEMAVVVLMGAGGAAHVVALGDNVDDVINLPEYTRPATALFIDPIEVEPAFCAMFDPERERVFAEISEGGAFPVTIREHHRNLRHEGHPVRATKWHK